MVNQRAREREREGTWNNDSVIWSVIPKLTWLFISKEKNPTIRWNHKEKVTENFSNFSRQLFSGIEWKNIYKTRKKKRERD